MFKNYIITAWRNLLRSKIFSLINIGGLSVGIASCILIFLYVHDELSYDKHWQNAERLVKINWEESTEGVPNPYSGTPFRAGELWKSDLPEVEDFTRILLRNNLTASIDGKYYTEDNNYVVDSNFLSMFNFELLNGDSKTCLSEPNSIVISEDLSKKIFGNTDPMGKILQYPKGPFKITGIIKNTLKKTMLKPTALLRLDYENEPIQYKESLTWLPAYTFLKLKRASDVKDFNGKLKGWKEKVIDPILLKANLGYNVALLSELVSESHFDNYFKDDFEKSDKNYVIIFGWVAVFLLLIACFNFINLSTARASTRLREVGVRKANGASRKQIIVQFLGESILTSILALVAGLLLLFFLAPTFSELTGKIIHLQVLLQNGAILTTAGILLFISFTGGIYPAVYLSGFNPVNILKGGVTASGKSRSVRFNLRQLLVISQFAISGVVIICTIFVYSQITMMKNKDLGFNMDQVLVLRFPKLDSLNKIKATTFKTKIADYTFVKGVSTARQLFGSWGNTLYRISHDGVTDQASLNWGLIDDNYIKLMNLKLTAGRNFSREFGDKECYIATESALKFLKIKNPFTAELSWDGENVGKIVGVIKDYNYASPHTKIEPMVFKYLEHGNLAFVKLSPQNITASIDQIAKEWKRIFPANPINYYFLDDKFNEEFYRNEDIMLRLLTSFSALTILISCLGLFGLAAFVTDQRVKEIAIRKVVGASAAHIVFQISKNFRLLVIIAGIIASPVAYYFIHGWLEDFAYRINISFWVFALSIFATLLIAFITMSTRTVKAANANPVKSLRTDG